MAGRTLTGLIPLVVVLALSARVSGESLESVSNLNLVGQIGGPIQGVAVQDSIAYVAVGPRLMVMQVSESGNLTELGGTSALPRFLRSVAISGSFAYVAAGEAGIYVVDVSDPVNPAVVGSWDSPGYAEAVAIAGKTLYVADGPYGLRTVDVTDATHPVEIGWAFPLHYAMDVAVSGNFAAIASVTAGLFVADVSDPSNPVEKGSLLTNGCAFGVDIDGRTAYIADGWGGLVSVDISPFGVPKILASYQTPGWAMDVAVEDGVALVSDGFKGMRVLDVSVPSSPEELSAFEFKGHAVKVLASDGRAYLIDKPSKLRVVDLSDTIDPAQISVFASAGEVEDVAVSGNYAYLASGASGFHVVEISDPSAPRQIAQFDLQGYAFRIAIDGDYALVTTFTAPTGLEILDVSDPAHPHRVSFFPTVHATYFDLETSGSTAFMPDEMGLAAVDYSDPAQPFEIGWIDLDGYGSRTGTAGVDILGDLAAVAQTASGTVFLDVSDPANMRVLGEFDSGWAWDATLAGNLAYVADLGLLVLDTSDPEDPHELGFVPSIEGNGREVILDATVAYMTHGKDGIFAYDVSDPHDPFIITEYDTLGSAEKGVIKDDLLYVADGGGGLIVLEALSSKGFDVSHSRALKRSNWRYRSQRRDAQIQNGTWRRRTATERISSSSRGRLQSIPVGEDPRSFRTRESRSRSPVKRIEQGYENSGRMKRAAFAGLRTQANSCQVTTTADSGSGSLRWCMEQAQSGDSIVFDPAVFPPHDPATILLSGELPQITQGGLTIDASELGVILDGHDLDIAGINIASDANTVRGLQIYHCDVGFLVFGNWNVIGGDRFVGSGPLGQGNVVSANGDGVYVWEGSHNIITGNLVGTDVTGKHAKGNEDKGIYIRGGHDNLVGGYEPGERNIVSANGGPGIGLGPAIGGQANSYENRIIGNYVGTDIDGGIALGNREFGIIVDLGPFGNLIEGNVCSGNEGTGIVITDPGTSYNKVVGNIIGLDASGTHALGNAHGGIYVGLTSAWFNRVGGSLPEDRNIVSGNHGEGINVAGNHQFVLGNYIGTDITGTQAIGNNTGVFMGLAEHSFVGGTRKEERNVISGNSQQGMMVVWSFNNLVMGNYIGVDSSGSVSLPNQEAVNLELASLNVFQSNLISGNEGGVVIHEGSERNLLRANRVGVAAGDPSAVPNDRQGVLIESASNQIGGPYPGDGNIIAHNNGGGVQVWTESGNTILGNSIYGNNGWGINLADGANGSLAAPEITRAISNTVWGTTCPNCCVDVFSDEDDQGGVYEGSIQADAQGFFEYSSDTRLHGPYITCTATDAEGNTSSFSDPEPLTLHRRPRGRVTP